MNENVVTSIESKSIDNKKIKKDDCVELKNIKYQTMLINNNIKVTDISTTHVDSINMFLSQEKEHNIKQPWSKLGNGTKLKKINIFINEYSEKNKYNKIQQKNLQNYLKKCMERKKLQRARDVNYDINKGKIVNIPGLLYNKNNNKFTLKNINKIGSTLKNLAPKNKKKTIKTKNKNNKTTKDAKKNIKNTKDVKKTKNKKTDETKSKKNIKNTKDVKKNKNKKTDIKKPKKVKKKENKI
tara:strand:+ start:1030 stop:1749 length:720 start_codon:yes stop_codon:yes gene_type:complete